MQLLQLLQWAKNLNKKGLSKKITAKVLKYKSKMGQGPSSGNAITLVDDRTFREEEEEAILGDGFAEFLLQPTATELPSKNTPRFITPVPFHPKLQREQILFCDIVFVKQHSGRFAGTWLHPHLKVSDAPEGETAKEGKWYRALYVYQLEKESFVINGVKTEFVNRMAGGAGVVDKCEFQIGKDWFELLDGFVGEKELVSGQSDLE